MDNCFNFRLDSNKNTEKIMSIKLSPTSKNMYLNCAMSYHIHYNLKLRKKITGSALIFGSAIDSGLNHLLLTKNLTEAKENFLQTMSNPEINGVKVNGSSTNLIKFSKSDLDESLLNKPTTQSDVVSTLIEDLSPKAVSSNEAWQSLIVKGTMMLEAYNKEVMPLIQEVLSVQERIEIPNGKGDFITGVIDFVARLDDGKVYICDNKTTSVAYKPDVLDKEAQQLATYWEAVSEKYGAEGVAYVVIDKSIRKKDPRVRINIIKGVLKEDMINKTFEEFEQALYGVRMGMFASNNPQCNSFYGKCICEAYLKGDGYSNELVYVGDKTK
jgi:ATP-dependent helicase/DNAse subunit B